MKKIRNAMAALFLAATMTVGGAAPVVAAQQDHSWCGNKDSLVVYGGSSGTGYLTTGYSHPLGHYAPTEHGWFANLTARAEQFWPGFWWRNYSKNGASVSTFLPGGAQESALADQDARDPNLAIVMLGTNEYLSGAVPVATYKARLNDLVTRIKAATPGISVLIVRQWYVPHHPRSQWEPFATAMSQVGTEQQVPLIDVGGVMPQMQYQVPNTHGFYNADRIHLSNEANYTLMSEIWGALACWSNSI